MRLIPEGPQWVTEGWVTHRRAGRRLLCFLAALEWKGSGLWKVVTPLQCGRDQYSLTPLASIRQENHCHFVAPGNLPIGFSLSQNWVNQVNNTTRYWKTGDNHASLWHGYIVAELYSFMTWPKAQWSQWKIPAAFGWALDQTLTAVFVCMMQLLGSTFFWGFHPFLILSTHRRWVS